MKITPKTQKEIDEMNVLPAGEYPFTISGATDKISKAGNEMIVLTLRVYKPDGNFILVTDYLMEKLAYKLRHCCEVCGLLNEYDGGVLLSEHFVGQEGTLKLKIDKDESGDYPDKNSVADYVVEKKGDAPKAKPPRKDAMDKALSGDGIEDDIPW